MFTQNTTESLNLVAYSYGMNFLHEGDEIVISVAEHHSNMVPWQRVAKATGAKLVYMYPGENGRLTTEELDKKSPLRRRSSPWRWSRTCWAWRALWKKL